MKSKWRICVYEWHTHRRSHIFVFIIYLYICNCARRAAHSTTTLYDASMHLCDCPCSIEEFLFWSVIAFLFFYSHSSFLYFIYFICNAAMVAYSCLCTVIFVHCAECRATTVRWWMRKRACACAMHKRQGIDVEGDKTMYRCKEYYHYTHTATAYTAYTTMECCLSTFGFFLTSRWDLSIHINVRMSSIRKKNKKKKSLGSLAVAYAWHLRFALSARCMKQHNIRSAISPSLVCSLFIFFFTCGLTTNSYSTRIERLWALNGVYRQQGAPHSMLCQMIKHLFWLGQLMCITCTNSIVVRTTARWSSAEVARRPGSVEHMHCIYNNNARASGRVNVHKFGRRADQYWHDAYIYRKICMLHVAQRLRTNVLYVVLHAVMYIYVQN